MAEHGLVITAYNEAKSGWRQRESEPGGKPCGAFSYEDDLSEKHEGNELLATLDSVRANSDAVHIVVVDDGSTDGCVDRAGEFGAVVVKHRKRHGIGWSRTEGVAALPGGCDTVMFLDAHQRISPGCVENGAEIALERDAIVMPDCRGLRDRPRYTKLKPGQTQETATQHRILPRTTAHKNETGWMFRNSLSYDKPEDDVCRSHALNSPGYTVPIGVWADMPISSLCRGFGGNEAMLWVKAFFLDVPILHTCKSMVRHLFRSHNAHYKATPLEVNRNMAVLAKTCFDAKTWGKFWWPMVFEGNVTRNTEKMLGCDQLWNEHVEFQAKKKRPDREFWLGLCSEPLPVEGIE
uniref:Putative glycosyltransferase n=1 Tax=viral metagenome TaxID=1070528 RepID=A0A6M3K428_9ZZZZ